MAIVKDLGRPESIIDPHYVRSNASRDNFAITPSDTINFTTPPREIVVGGAGTVAIVEQDDTVVSYTVVAGQRITDYCKRVNSTGTTATGLVGVR